MDDASGAEVHHCLEQLSGDAQKGLLSEDGSAKRNDQLIDDLEEVLSDDQLEEEVGVLVVLGVAEALDDCFVIALAKNFELFQ